MYCKPEAAIYYQLFFYKLELLQLKTQIIFNYTCKPKNISSCFRAPELVRDRREPGPGGGVHQEGAGARHLRPPHHRHQRHQAHQLRPLDVQVRTRIVSAK